MRKAALTLILSLIVSPAFAETIKLGGSGSMIPMLNDIAKAYMQKNHNDQVEVNQKSMGQPGGIAALNAGAVDIALSGMSLTDDQVKLPVKPYLIAHVAGVVAVTNDVKTQNLSSSQLCDIYAGRITNWKQVGGSDSPIQVYTRPEADSTKVKFRKGFACMEKLQEGKDVTSLAKSQDMFDTLSKKKGAIGIVDAIAMSEAGGKFKALKIDGKSFEQLATGNWPFYLRNSLVVRNDNKKEAVRKFLEFVKTPEGQAIIRQNKGIPVPFNL